MRMEPIQAYTLRDIGGNDKYYWDSELRKKIEKQSSNTSYIDSVKIEGRGTPLRSSMIDGASCECEDGYECRVCMLRRERAEADMGILYKKNVHVLVNNREL